MNIMNGKVLSNIIKDELKECVEEHNLDVNLTVIQVGNDPASSVYVKNKMNACHYIGIKSDVYVVDESVTEQELINLIEVLNEDSSVDGILVQLPLPKHLNSQNILEKIDPSKDVDGFHANNMGNLVLGNRCFVPCTPLGIAKLLRYYGVNPAGTNCVVVGRSNIVGKPMAMLMLQNNATVTICHSKTENLKEVCRNADILICAIGQPKFFTQEYVKPGAVVVDVGIHRMEDGKLCGDVDFDDVANIASAITPVPGGVGPMTVASLMSNCVEAAMMKK